MEGGPLITSVSSFFFAITILPFHLVLSKEWLTPPLLPQDRIHVLFILTSLEPILVFDT